MSIPEPLSRQCPDRYAFRAGRNLPTRNFATLGTVIVYGRRSPGLRSPAPLSSGHQLLDPPALGRRQPPYMVLRLCGDLCFWVKQSPGLVNCDPLCEEAPLLPKLRGYFAEFLRESFLAPLGILYLPTCVGFRVQYPFLLKSFELFLGVWHGLLQRP
ncbi:Cell wall-associated hydrolase [Quillaja saponaria]|uniref:Cell wall-associated hydrolase n=1 Tax=Quillaja saponaria TaxID=32244 RepID=A0AAD7KLL1_QUISA|nr:Cell wall-associated hydrolase [Quillaja saponaria]